MSHPRPTTKTLIVGHPIVAMPLLLASIACLLAGFRSGAAPPVIIGIAMIAAVNGAQRQANAYRAWKAEWDAMDGRPKAPRSSPGQWIGAVLLAALILVGCFRPSVLAYGAGFAVGWISHEPWLLGGLAALAVAIIVQFVRCWPRRPKAARPVTVVAKRILPVPSIADAYARLPDYCQALLRGRS